MRRRPSLLSVAIALVGCSMPNPQWTASDVGGDPTATSDVGTTNGGSQGSTSVTETTTTTDVTTEPTTGSTSTTDVTATASVTTDPMTTTSGDPTTTSTTTGEDLCENWDFNEDGAIEPTVDVLPPMMYEFPTTDCKAESPYIWTGFLTYVADGERTELHVEATDGCTPLPGLPKIVFSGKLPADFDYVGDKCVRARLFLVDDGMGGCTKLEGFEVTGLDDVLFLSVGAGRLELSQGLAGMYDDNAMSGEAEPCEDNGEGCGVSVGILKLAHTLADGVSISEQSWHIGDGSYDFYNSRSHNHGSLDAEATCAHHQDWLLRRSK
ncbi:MAG: hypothetical protein R3A79_13610 [Nannocystaceae bacterium]